MSNQHRDAALRILEEFWVPSHGYTSPNPRRYRWQWLWDSCFHSIAWSGFGDPRALTELESLFKLQLKSGFLPHMGYQMNPKASKAEWRSWGHSDITQPPMYGHALSVLASRGYNVSHLTDAATKAMMYLFEHRLDGKTGLIRIVHPWESGCDDSPRWDAWHHGKFHRYLWNIRKYRLVRSLRVVGGAAIANPAFEVCSASFNALVAFNAQQLALLTGNQKLAQLADKLADALDKNWDPQLRTWVDVAPKTGKVTSRVRTLESLLPVLVSKNSTYVDEAFNALMDPNEFWAPYGPRGVSKQEPTYDASKYWRGSMMWPVFEMMRVAAVLRGKPATATALASAGLRAAVASGWPEHVDVETGRGLGAIPQGWATIAHESELALNAQPQAFHQRGQPWRWRIWSLTHRDSPDNEVA